MIKGMKKPGLFVQKGRAEIRLSRPDFFKHEFEIRHGEANDGQQYGYY
jgi:hypothetical protein